MYIIFDIPSSPQWALKLLHLQNRIPLPPLRPSVPTCKFGMY